MGELTPPKWRGQGRRRVALPDAGAIYRPSGTDRIDEVLSHFRRHHPDEKALFIVVASKAGQKERAICIRMWRKRSSWVPHDAGEVGIWVVDEGRRILDHRTGLPRAKRRLKGEVLVRVGTESGTVQSALDLLAKARRARLVFTLQHGVPATAYEREDRRFWTEKREAFRRIASEALGEDAEAPLSSVLTPTPKR